MYGKRRVFQFQIRKYGLKKSYVYICIGYVRISDIIRRERNIGESKGVY